MALIAPEFDIERSALLRAVIDDTGVQVWDFRTDTGVDGRVFADETDPALREEVEERIDEVLAGSTEVDLAAFARDDPFFSIGHIRPGELTEDPAAEARRLVALRVIELGLARSMARLERDAFGPPQRDARAFSVVPGLWDALNDEGLLPLDADRAPEVPMSAEGYVNFGDHVLFPHPDLRHSRELWWDLCELAREGLAVRVAIDPHRVVVRDELPMKLIEDYWFGVKVTRDNLDSLADEDLGWAIHYRNPDSELGRRLEIFYPLLATEFRWSRGPDALKLLDVEEIVPPESSQTRTDDIVRNRYLHSHRDATRRAFVHANGALRVYDAEKYTPSREAPLAGRDRLTEQRKLWHVHGELTDEKWSRLLTGWFRQNELVIEYFGELLDER
ncbi:MAG TPA: hypothetical protein VF225_00590 [Gaiellaceae bacterium]